MFLYTYSILKETFTYTIIPKFSKNMCVLSFDYYFANNIAIISQIRKGEARNVFAIL